MNFANYVSRVKEMHIAAGHKWTQKHELAARGGGRSVTRGQGPPRQSAPFDVEKLAALPADTVVERAGGVANLQPALILGLLSC